MTEEFKEPKINAGLEIMLDETLQPNEVKPMFRTIQQVKLGIPDYLLVGKDVFEALKKIPEKEER